MKDNFSKERMFCIEKIFGSYIGEVDPRRIWYGNALTTLGYYSVF